MDFGVLGSFENAMADLSREELEQANAQPPIVEAELVTDGPRPDATFLSDGVFGGGTRNPVAAPPIDERARELALRLVGARVKPGPKPTRAVTVEVVGYPPVEVSPAAPGPITIGRGAADESSPDTNYLVIDLAVASREHCRIGVLNDCPVVADLGSTNGTSIRREGGIISVGAQPIELRPGDLVTTAGGAAVLATIGTVGP